MGFYFGGEVVGVKITIVSTNEVKIFTNNSWNSNDWLLQAKEYYKSLTETCKISTLHKCSSTYVPGSEAFLQWIPNDAFANVLKEN